VKQLTIRKRLPVLVKPRNWPRPSYSSQNLLKYLNAIDDRDGKALWMDFYRIAGNTTNTRRWIKYLSDRGLIADEREEIVGQTKTVYFKTKLGQAFHDILRNNRITGMLTTELGKRKLSRAF
jgi:hypothetical protein